LCYIKDVISLHTNKEKTKWDAVQNEFVGGWFHSLSNLKKCGTVLKSFKKIHRYLFFKKHDVAFLNFSRAGSF
jgi:hypothetical protein